MCIRDRCRRQFAPWPKNSAETRSCPIGFPRGLLRKPVIRGRVSLHGEAPNCQRSAYEIAFEIKSFSRTISKSILNAVRDVDPEKSSTKKDEELEKGAYGLATLRLPRPQRPPRRMAPAHLLCHLCSPRLRRAPCTTKLAPEQRPEFTSTWFP